jgi:chloride channel 7
MVLLEEFLLEETIEITEHILNSGNNFGAWLCYGGLCACFGMIASLMTTYYGPGASGSGVAELIGYLNGINYPNFMCIPSLLTKIIGVSFAVSGRLCVGKEGPLAHIGGILGNCVLYLPGLGFEHMRNDETKRLFIAAGASTGVSVAFGAPIGGALFCYELSQPNTFWKFKMIWKVFFACSLGTFVLAIW